MAEVVKLVQGSQSLDLTAGNYVAQEVILNPSPPNELWHQPDQGERRMVRSEAADRSCTVKIRVPITVTNEDTLQNAIVAIRRYLAEAIRYELNGDNSPVYLQLQKNNATNAVNHRIKSGVLDDSQSHYRPERTVKTQALDLFLNLTLAPYGEWTSTITLNNYLTSSPHFVEDTDADGLADGWIVVGTPSTTAIDTTNWLIGGQSQKVITDAGGEGIASDLVATGSNATAVMYAWVYVASGSATVRLWNHTDTAAITDVVASLANSDKTATDSAGNTWWRIPVSGSYDAGDELRAYVFMGSTGTMYIDGVYLELGTTAAPDAWMSARAIDNRNDIQATSAATENYLNYIDVWGVPGDAPALVEHKFDFTTVSVALKQIVTGRYAEGVVGIGDIVHWIESDEFSAGSGDATASTSTGTSDNHYHRATDLGSGVSVRTYDANYTGTGALYRSFGARHMYGIVRASSASSLFRLSVRADSLGAAKHQSAWLGVTTVDTWELMDFGAMDISQSAASNYPDSLYQQVRFAIELDINDVSGTADIDALIIMPITAEHLFIQAGAYGLDATDDLYIEGKYKRLFYENAENIPSFLGSMWEAEPGSATNRIMYILVEADNESVLTNAASVQLRIIPRTTHLLGT